MEPDEARPKGYKAAVGELAPKEKYGKADYDAEELRKVAIGPSGNLRAPTLRAGKSWYVGFSEEAYNS